MSALLDGLELLGRDWLLVRSIQTLPLFAVVLIVDALCGRRLGPETRGVLWTLVLALPCLPLGLEADWAPLPAPALGLETVAAGPSAWTLVLLWAAGALATVLVGLHRGRALRRGLASLPHCERPTLPALVRATARSLGLRRAPEVRVLDGLGEALTLGLLRPRVLLPATLVLAAEHSARARSRLVQVLAHELAHVRRRDPLRAALRGLCMVPFWFHPLLRVARRRAELCAELSCDRLALHGTGAGPDEYGRTLLDQARRWITPRPAAMSAFLGPRSMLLARLDALSGLQRPGRPLLGLVLATLIGVCCIPAARTIPGPRFDELQGCLQKRFFVLRALAEAGPQDAR